MSNPDEMRFTSAATTSASDPRLRGLSNRFPEVLIDSVDQMIEIPDVDGDVALEPVRLVGARDLTTMQLERDRLHEQLKQVPEMETLEAMEAEASRLRERIRAATDRLNDFGDKHIGLINRIGKTESTWWLSNGLKARVLGRRVKGLYEKGDIEANPLQLRAEVAAAAAAIDHSPIYASSSNPQYKTRLDEARGEARRAVEEHGLTPLRSRFDELNTNIDDNLVARGVVAMDNGQFQRMSGVPANADLRRSDFKVIGAAMLANETTRSAIEDLATAVGRDRSVQQIAQAFLASPDFGVGPAPVGL